LSAGTKARKKMKTNLTTVEKNMLKHFERLAQGKLTNGRWPRKARNGKPVKRRAVKKGKKTFTQLHVGSAAKRSA